MLNPSPVPRGPMAQRRRLSLLTVPLMIASGETPAGVDIIVSKPVTLAALRQSLAKVTAEKIPVAE